jgi:hypothetical protein
MSREKRKRQPRKSASKVKKRGQTGASEVGGYKTVRFKRDSPGRHSKSKLSARAKAQKELEKEHAFQGTFTAIYQKPVDVNQTVQIENLGKLFSRRYVIESVEIDFGPGKLDVQYSTSGD